MVLAVVDPNMYLGEKIYSPLADIRIGYDTKNKSMSRSGNHIAQFLISSELLARVVSVICRRRNAPHVLTFSETHR